MKTLLLTLGHNSSCCMIENNRLVWGYETERISGVKSDSRFPMPFMANHLKSSLANVDMAYVSHWAPDGKLSSMSAKHWDPAWFDGVPIRTLSVDRTHHDAHIWGAACYAGFSFCSQPKTFGLVVDGFGTFGEHFSVYKFVDGLPVLYRRIHGYGTSLGLWYQYATAFMGMKMHEDEYKLLGYEVHVPNDECDVIHAMAVEKADQWLNSMDESIYGSVYDPVYSIDALAATKEAVWSHLLKVCKELNIPDSSSMAGRARIAFYVQAVLENVVFGYTDGLNAHNLLLSGGCFYNVKLNKRLVDRTPGKVCVYPLCGDQGNAIGMYAQDHPEFVFPSDLNWGARLLYDLGEVPGLTVCNQDDGFNQACTMLQARGCVNVVKGAMEFGPRAMCNTSTLAKPTLEVVQKINSANDRNTVMPMAPVVTRRMYETLFERTDRVHRSEKHMVVAMEYAEHPLDEMLGVAHRYEWPTRHHTGRPQVIDRGQDPFVEGLIGAVGGPLINTSFNFHGQPIALGMDSIIANHMMQHQRDPSFTTVVIQNDK